MLREREGMRWLPWRILDHLLLIVLIVMVATIFSVLLIRPSTFLPEPGLQRSVPEER